jgi:hypothetical protein
MATGDGRRLRAPQGTSSTYLLTFDRSHNIPSHSQALGHRCLILCRHACVTWASSWKCTRPCTSTTSRATGAPSRSTPATRYCACLLCCCSLSLSLSIDACTCQCITGCVS